MTFQEHVVGWQTMAEKYLCTAQLILEKNVEHWNKHFLISDKIEQNIKYYNKETKRSDFYISIPTLFLFYHGLEVMMKWVILSLWNKPPKTHNLVELFNIMKNNPQTEKICKLIKKYVIIDKETHKILQQLMNDNKGAKKNKQWVINDFYNFLKYPFNNEDSIQYNHLSIKYKEDDFISFATELIKDIDDILIESNIIIV